MMKRCYATTSRKFPDYGGRGILVCQRWHEFVNFFHDLGPKPSAKHTLERQDNEKAYEPGNAIWATMKAQSRNKRNSHFVEFQGLKLTLADWAIRTGIAFHTLLRREKRSWSVERMLTTPSDTRFSKHWRKRRQKPASPA